MSYIIMSRCNCSQCSRHSSSKCSSRRDDSSTHKCRTSPKRKHRACNCNKYSRRVSPKCGCDDSCGDDIDNQSNGNSQSHHFIITVKTNN